MQTLDDIAIMDEMLNRSLIPQIEEIISQEEIDAREFAEANPLTAGQLALILGLPLENI